MKIPAPNPSTPEATRAATEWRTTQRTYPAIRGTNQLAVTPEEFDEALEAYASSCNRDMLAVLKAIAIAQKEPAGGEYWTARELANKWGIFTDDLAGERVLLKLAEYAIAKAEAQ